MLIGVCASGLPAEEPKPAAKPAGEADAVFAVYHCELGLSDRPGRSVIFAAWADGRVAWSKDRLYGGPPYRTGRVAVDRVADLLARLEANGLFADKKLSWMYAGGEHPEFLAIRVRSGKNVVHMSSWHELVEDSGKNVAIERRREALNGRHRLDVLREAPPDYRHFRFVWAETRARMAELIPVESTPTERKPVWEAGPVLYWQEQGTPPKSKIPELGPAK
jgi:hypothetical protein